MARDTRRDGEIRQVELDLPRRGTGRGEALAVSARVAPLGSRLVLLLVEDLTEARRIEAVRRDFVANVSHELKTPVGALSLLSEAVMDASDDPEAVERFAGRMQIEATRLTNLVQELIDLSRVQNDDPLEDAEPVRVDELVAEAIDRCRHQAGTKQITMAANAGVPEGLDLGVVAGDGGGTADLRVWGNRGQLAAALGNLVENAVNYSPARTRVGIAARRVTAPGGDLIEIAVTDQGIGISEKDRERIFERFYRVDPARSRATGGTGLGLAIVKHVAASHGGEVTVWSSEGQGSTFTLGCRRRARPATAHTSGPRSRRRGRTASPTTPTHPRTNRFPPRRSFRDPSARRRGRGVLQRRPVLHAPQGGLRGRHRDHRARRPRRVRAQRRRPRPPRPDAARPARHRGLPPAARPLQRPGDHGHRQGQRDRQGRRAWK